jgi:hypothetical protein
MKHFKPATLAASLIAAAVLLPAPAMAHCDGIDGPVVTTAKRSLENGSVNLVLPWVRAEDEPAIRRAFEHVSAVRKLGPEAKQLADHYFFETVVRVHRAAEGAPYTGLQPAGRDLGAAIPAADQALAAGSPESLEKVLVEAVRKGLHEQYHNAHSLARFDADDVAAGRRYVQAYVPYVHYVERLWDAAAQPAHEHAHAAPQHAHAD